MKMYDVIHGFRVVDAVSSEELGGTLWKLEHQKTGAPLIWLDNGQDNKLFSISFKTIPRDDTGVFHILEHSVLGGSERFPVKEPFLELLKSSMNTFLNAMTFPDKTMYPVSSRNEQDFINLCTVYLDAVLFPAIYHNLLIFAQEGWHYELHEGDSAPTYKGVVFNEMKGAYSSVDRVVDRELCRMLFPGHCYGYVSGGDPVAIPKLTYEQFIEAHREFYHPTNSKTYLDGNVPIDRVLALIDSYFSRFEKEDRRHEIPQQAALAATEAVRYYEIGKDEDEKNKAQLALGKVFGAWDQKKKLYAADILATYLTGSNAAPLKKAILEAGLGEDVWLSVDTGMAQSYIMLRVRNTEQEHKEAIKKVVRTAVEGLISQGLDREELEANINHLEFALKETEEPRGIERAINAMSAWLYGGRPEEYLMNEEVIAELRAELDTDYFSQLLGEMLLDEAHLSTLVVLPSKSLGDLAREEEAARLKEAAAAWSEADRAQVLQKTAALEAWQQAEDPPEAVATLPMLSLSHIDPKPEKIETHEDIKQGVKCLFHPIPTSGVVHAKLYFNLNDAAFDQLSTLSFLASLLGELPTEKHSVAELQKAIKKNIGRINFGVEAYSVVGSPEKCRVLLAASFSVLEKRLPEAVAIVAEILKTTRFDQTEEIRRCLLQACRNKHQAIIGRGNRYAAGRVNRNFLAERAVNEQISGFDMYRAMLAFSKDFEGQIGHVTALAKRLCEGWLTPARLTLSHTAERERPELLDIVSLLGEPGTSAPEYMTPPLSREAVKEAIRIPAGISYAALGSELSLCGTEYSGALEVLSSILSLGYLWNEIRVRGGAYGCGFMARRGGNLAFHSFRDPTPLRSLDVYRDTASYIRGFVAGEEGIEKYIISSVAGDRPLLSACQMGAHADSRYFSGVTYEDECRKCEQMLALQKEELLTLCPLFEKLGEQGSVCIIAHEGVVATLDESWQIFDL